MTPEEINRAIAEKVMGWTGPHGQLRYWKEKGELTLHSDFKARPQQYWDPYHRWDHAGMVVEKMVNKRHTFQMGSGYETNEDFWAMFDGDVGSTNISHADTGPAAICLASLKARGLCTEDTLNL